MLYVVSYGSYGILCHHGNFSNNTSYKWRVGLDYGEEVHKRSRITAQDRVILGNGRYGRQDEKLKIFKNQKNKQMPQVGVLSMPSFLFERLNCPRNLTFR